MAKDCSKLRWKRLEATSMSKETNYRQCSWIIHRNRSQWEKIRSLSTRPMLGTRVRRMVKIRCYLLSKEAKPQPLHSSSTTLKRWDKLSSVIQIWWMWQIVVFRTWKSIYSTNLKQSKNWERVNNFSINRHRQRKSDKPSRQQKALLTRAMSSSLETFNLLSGTSMCLLFRDSRPQFKNKLL